jgi:NTP pyrophosphatase (non-canonical NTP hydrolase)
MTINEYQELAMRTANPEVDRDGMLLNGVMGLCGEAGECIDLVKKNRFQGHELDRDRLIGELGDVAWYLAEAAYALGVDLEEVLSRNVEKLRKRYPHFRLGSAELVRKNLQFLDAPKGVVAYRIEAARGHIVDHVIVVLNFTRQEQCIDIPEGDYFILAASGVIDLDGIDHLKGDKAVVAPQSALIIQN